MGCNCSKGNVHMVKDDDEASVRNDAITENEGENEGNELPRFRVYTIEQVRTATSNFAEENEISGWNKASGRLYKGTLEDERNVSVVRIYFHSKQDAQQFLKDARVVGRLRDQRLMNLLGCCNEGEEIMLIAEFMSNGTLARHLFYQETPSMKWAMRLRVALFVAQTLEYCTSKRAIIYNLNPHNIFFDEVGNPRLSSFSLLQRVEKGQVVFISDMVYEAHECQMVYSFGCLLLVLLSGKEIVLSRALDLIKGGKVDMLMDSRLKGQLSSCDVNEVASLATLCLQENKKSRPKPKTLVSFLSPLQKENEVACSVLMGLENGGGEVKSLSALGEACKRKDLTAIYEILVNLGYKDDDGAITELSFKMWANQIHDTINSKKNGDVSFRVKDFNAAIKSYTKFIDADTMLSPTVFARRSLSYLMINSPEEARNDAIRAQEIFRTWHIASYLQAAALFALGKDNEAQTAILKGSLLEGEKTQLPHN